MEGVHLPEWLDGSSGRHHELLGASRVDPDELRDVIDTVFIGDPDSRGQSAVLGDFCSTVYWQILRNFEV